jgi:hypothetical protein
MAVITFDTLRRLARYFSIRGTDSFIGAAIIDLVILSPLQASRGRGVGLCRGM